MLRRGLVLLGRPKGPLGQRPGGEYRLTVPFRTEVAMLSQLGLKIPNGNVRELYKLPLEQNHLTAVPRDLGELPRNYVLKALFMHQPIRLLDLWEILKQNDDVPLDSAKHLRLVLKIAKLQRWAYTEKNQTDNQYYYHVDRARAAEVEAMVRADEAARKQIEANEAAAAAAAAAAGERAGLLAAGGESGDGAAGEYGADGEESWGAGAGAEEMVSEEAALLDEQITALQALLVSNLSHLQNYDPEYVSSKPYVTESGAVNCAWHWSGAAATASGADASAS